MFGVFAARRLAGEWRAQAPPGGRPAGPALLGVGRHLPAARGSAAPSGVNKVRRMRGAGPGWARQRGPARPKKERPLGHGASPRDAPGRA